MILPDWFDPDSLYECFHTLAHEGRSQMCRSPLQYDEDRFWLVLEWQDTHDGEIPSHRVPLDPKWLQPPLTPEQPWVYQVPVEPSR